MFWIVLIINTIHCLHNATSVVNLLMITHLITKPVARTITSMLRKPMITVTLTLARLTVTRIV